MEPTDLGLLLLRVVLGALLVGHGTQKLFGWFGGFGLEGIGGWLHSLGFRPGRPMAVVAGAVEAVGGVLLVAGLLTPIAAAAVVGQMVVAAMTHRGKGVWATSGGYELALVDGVAAAALALAGPGALSLDAALGLDELWSDGPLAGAGLGAVLCAITVAAALLLVARADRALAEPEIDLRDRLHVVRDDELSTTGEVPSRSAR
jgi:putative oxidoreductase